MSIKQINIKDNEKTLEVHVVLNERDDRKGHTKMRFETSDVLEFLNKEKVSYEKCIQEQTLKNWHPQLLSGVWVFNKPSPVKTKPRRTKTSTRRKNTNTEG